MRQINGEQRNVIAFEKPTSRLNAVTRIIFA